MRTLALSAVSLLAALVLPSVEAAAGAPPAETVTQIGNQLIPTVPGKRLVVLQVDYPPGARSPSHRHARSAFISAHVLFGNVRSAVNGTPAQVYRPGEGWTETPGSHHTVSENASEREPARLLAIFIVDADDADVLTVPDAR